MINPESFYGDGESFEDANKENFDKFDERCRNLKNIIKMIEEFEVPRLCKPKDFVPTIEKIYNAPIKE